ncbi:hypothetical protein T03_436 [Trichinella britovi]|uniref:Uncharacterized protein n=1 Tax=Trichinella britovi TaxID=45882 RepID=A0A0V1CCS7_TRIBR|nr:hypothetical protein T03_436 [Trichinella britovi]
MRREEDVDDENGDTVVNAREPACQSLLSMYLPCLCYIE